MDLVTVIADNCGILQEAFSLQSIVPGRTSRHQRIGFMAGALYIINSVRRRKQSIVAHVFTGKAAAKADAHHNDGRESNQLFHCYENMLFGY